MFESGILYSVTGAFGKHTLAVLGASVSYVIVCNALRYRRRNQKHAQSPYKTRDDYSKMTTDDAWAIMKYILSLEFPLLSETALQFALFRTYGIQTISKLLCETKQLASLQNAPRRYDDTRVLIGEFLSYAPTTKRANSAIARMNYLHGNYQKVGKISNDDLLYTLSLFLLEPRRWIERHEWRTLTPMELCALGTFWKSIGDAMEISYEPLSHGPSNFKDGLEFMEDMELWSNAYEKRTMIPNDWNHKLANETTAILLTNVPPFLKPTGKHAVEALMDERLRRAMIYDDPPPLISKLVYSALYIRKLVIRHLLPPRPYFLRKRDLSDDPDPVTGRYYKLIYESEPWYVKPTFFVRNSPSSWLRWAIGRPYPDGKNYKPEGYDILEVGPPSKEKVGRAQCEATRDKLLAADRGRCPFAFSKS
ncbi:hypothetical protein BU24DRAFT_112336 [Aaosphaeria arxii CBS 175.79]|uniref:ER-bound oxygenase mpaB/mpaB'/Rubber oxygenase catalytic domain-containing protein n=1 Tax=Aaosphaeria arxii CBS 175.79 TaxID=1450172 RepID=A0A6A5Y1Z8_9PLEO|nr:uncharacterized protein BU24DRAFT_112336 [Aaosphaeria arxii CBS 175.79]KAF2019087.1 hypothetical protein BU24DRAFT_112336 [Aaosphaeria arxii CBS 175.79]